MTTASRADAEALATFVCRLRPPTGDGAWGQAGTVKAILAVRGAALSEIAIALIRLAEDQTVRTPALLPEPGPHWYRASHTETAAGPNLRNIDWCPLHPGVERVKCKAHEVPTPMSAEVREQIQAAIRAGKDELGITSPDRRERVPSPVVDLDAARARLDRDAAS